MRKRTANGVLSALLGMAFGVALLANQHAAKATDGYTMRAPQDLRFDKRNCSATCNGVRYDATSWRSNNSIYAQFLAPQLSGGGTAHVKAHAGCRQGSNKPGLWKSGFSTLNEAVGVACNSYTATGMDCEIEVASWCQ